jgi:hypothetical protein
MELAGYKQLHSSSYRCAHCWAAAFAFPDTDSLVQHLLDSHGLRGCDLTIEGGDVYENIRETYRG